MLGEGPCSHVRGCEHASRETDGNLRRLVLGALVKEKTGTMTDPSRLRLSSSARSLALPVVLMMVAALVGWITATRDPSQAAVVVAASILLAVGIVATRAGWTALQLFGVIVLFVSALVDVPRTYDAGLITGLGAITIAYAVVTWFLWIPQRPLPIPRAGLRVYGLFLAWSVGSFLWHPPSIQGFQNVAVFLAFAMFARLVAKGCVVSPTLASFLARWFDRAIVLSALLYIASAAIAGFDTEVLFGPRAFALFALLGLGRALARFRYESRQAGWMVLIILVAILASLSRSALAISAILVPIAWLDRRTLSRRLGVALIICATVGVFAFAAASFGPLQERFAEPDRVKVGGVDLSVQGRGVFWGATWRSWLESPWIGHGAGSSETIVQRQLNAIQAHGYSHPHNDYLRLLHDYGIIGWALWFIAFIALLRRTRRDWLRAVATRSSSAIIHMTAFLGMLTLGLSMITDNTIVYVFVMAPLGILVGASLGVSERTSEGEGNGSASTRPPSDRARVLVSSQAPRQRVSADGSSTFGR
jgi:O-antigen ligase